MFLLGVLFMVLGVGVSIALHEIGHAQDFASRRYRGTYAFIYMFPFVSLYHEFKASEHAFQYERKEKIYKTEYESYKLLYPAYATYLRFGLLPVILGHIIGRVKASDFEDRMEHQGIKVKEASVINRKEAVVPTTKLTVQI